MWLPLTEDFTDRERFAGEQNIAHIINVALLYPFARREMMSDARGLLMQMVVPKL